MKTYTPSSLRQDVYRVLDEVIATGRPIAVRRNGSLLKIIPPVRKSRCDSLKKRKGLLVDPEELVHLEWGHEWKPKHF